MSSPTKSEPYSRGGGEDVIEKPLSIMLAAQWIGRTTAGYGFVAVRQPWHDGSDLPAPVRMAPRAEADSEPALLDVARRALKL
jgi:hypothetical protein